MVSVVAVALVIAGCSKSEKKEAAPPTGSASGSAAAATDAAVAAEPAEPVEAAAVSGPTKSASGTLEVTGPVAGTFQWVKKDQRSPISCAWDHEKEIGGVKIDVSDGAGKLLTLTLDVPPAELGPGTMNVTSKDLAAPFKGAGGFSISGDEPGLFKVKLDAKLGEDKASQLAIKGTLDVTCPPKK